MVDDEAAIRFALTEYFRESGWLVDAAAIVAQQALRDSSYAPYARTMRKICWEESVHIMHGRDVVVTLMNGTAAQRALVQDALDRWWGPLMQMHGPRSDRTKDRDLHWRIKAKTSEELRQEFDAIVLCGGATKPRDLPVEGAGLAGVLPGVGFLRDIGISSPPNWLGTPGTALPAPAGAFLW